MWYFSSHLQTYKHISSSATFTPVYNMPRQTTQSQCKTSHLFWRSNRNLRGKNKLCGAFTCDWIRVGIMEWLMQQSSDKSNDSLIYVITCVSGHHACLCMCRCVYVSGSWYETHAFPCLPMEGKYQCEGVYNQGMEELICNISFKTCRWRSRQSHASPSLL